MQWDVYGRWGEGMVGMVRCIYGGVYMGCRVGRVNWGVRLEIGCWDWEVGDRMYRDEMGVVVFVFDIGVDIGVDMEVSVGVG